MFHQTEETVKNGTQRVGRHAVGNQNIIMKKKFKLFGNINQTPPHTSQLHKNDSYILIDVDWEFI